MLVCVFMWLSSGSRRWWCWQYKYQQQELKKQMKRKRKVQSIKINTRKIPDNNKIISSHSRICGICRNLTNQYVYRCLHGNVFVFYTNMMIGQCMLCMCAVWCACVCACKMTKINNRREHDKPQFLREFKPNFNSMCLSLSVIVCVKMILKLHSICC